jgi:hypothetical protein
MQLRCSRSIRIGVHHHQNQHPAAYPPEIEARRLLYEALAESFALQFHLSSENDLLDIQNPVFTDKDSRVMAALHEHWDCLAADFDWLEPRTMRKFYAEMRLWRDFLTWERAQDAALRDEPQANHIATA